MYQVRSMNTLNTTRVCGGNHFQNAIEITNLVYAGKSPEAIIIANGEIIQDALISTSLIHSPNNAPILFSLTNYIDVATVDQIYKLKPEGANGTQIFLTGGISAYVGNYLGSLGFRVKSLSGSNYYETAANIAHYLNNPDNIILIGSENYLDGLSACAWSAHTGTPILLTSKNSLPSYTREAIQLAKEPNVYLFGSTASISEQVEKELMELNINHLERIDGSDPYEVAVNFAQYKSSDGRFGWGKMDTYGHSFTFTSTVNPFLSAVGSIFAHLDKPSPNLVINRDHLPSITSHYLESVKPIPQEAYLPPHMHGWVVGGYEHISHQAQLELESLLAINKGHMINHV